MPRWGARTSSFPGAFQVSRQTFRELEDLIRDLEGNERQFRRAENMMVHLLAATHKGFAQRMSRGMVDPTGQAGRPWTIPVRRMTSEYFRGWNIRRIGHAQWEVYNEARHAYFIEFGINPRATGVVRRPILKMSAVATLRFIQRTRVAERFQSTTIGALRNNRGQYRSFQARMMGSEVMGIIGPEGSLPG